MSVGLTLSFWFWSLFGWRTCSFMIFSQLRDTGLLIEFAFHKPAFATAYRYTKRQHVALKQVGGSERGVGHRDVEHRATFAHGQRGSYTETPFVEGVLIAIGKLHPHAGFLVVQACRIGDAAHIVGGVFVAEHLNSQCVALGGDVAQRTLSEDGV